MLVLVTVELPPLQQGLAVGWQPRLAPLLAGPEGAQVLAGVVLAVGVLDHWAAGHAETRHCL